MSSKVKIAISLDPEMVEWAEDASKGMFGASNKSAYINMLLSNDRKVQGAKPPKPTNTEIGYPDGPVS